MDALKKSKDDSSVIQRTHRTGKEENILQMVEDTSGISTKSAAL